MNTNHAVSLDHIVLTQNAKYRFVCSVLSRSALLSHTTQCHCARACHMTKLPLLQRRFILETIISYNYVSVPAKYHCVHLAWYKVLAVLYFKIFYGIFYVTQARLCSALLHIAKRSIYRLHT